MALIKGKQLADSSVADGKLVEAYINSDGTRAFSGAQSMGNNKLTNMANGTDPNDAVNLSQLDAATTGLSWKDSVRLSSEASIADLSSITVADFDGQAQGVTLVEGDRVLVKDTASSDGVEAVSAKRNGIYIVGTVTTGTAPLTRTTDADTEAELLSSAVFVEEGANADAAFVMTTDSGYTLDTDDLAWVQFTGAGQINAGSGLTKSGNTINAGDANKGVQVNTDDFEVDAFEIAGDGLKQNVTNSWQLDIEPNDFAGAGLVDDGSDNLAVGDADRGVQVNADSIEIDGSEMVASAGGLQENGTNSWQIEVKPDSTTGGDTAPVTVASNGVGVDVTTLDGDHLTISWDPANYTPDTSPTESADVDDLTAHLKGIDNELATQAAAAPVSTSGNKEMTALVTASDGDKATNTTVAATPTNDSYVGVRINGVHYIVGDGVKTKDCYFSADAGTTARAISAVASGDELFWNGSVAGFELDATDKIDFDYEV
jgi:hypothetical protein